MDSSPSFRSLVAVVDQSASRATTVRTLMLNLGLQCNLQCNHCHVDASPERDELMDDATIERAINLARKLRPELVDITGGAPEMHPRLHYLVSALRTDGLRTRIRTNLVALAEPERADLVAFLASAEVDLLGSLPGVSDIVTDRQRGDGTHEASLAALWKLNAHGFGSRLRLDLAHNPDGTRLPDSVDLTTRRYRSVLSGHGIAFNDVVVITNVPVGRFEATLRENGSYDEYMARLKSSFNPRTLPRLECRETIEVGWDGTLWDCDFNLGAGLPAFGEKRNVSECTADEIATREITFGDHCFACTAAFGSG